MNSLGEILWKHSHSKFYIASIPWNGFISELAGKDFCTLKYINVLPYLMS